MNMEAVGIAWVDDDEGDRRVEEGEGGGAGEEGEEDSENAKKGGESSRQQLEADIARWQADLPVLVAEGRTLEATVCLGMTAHGFRQLGRVPEAIEIQRRAIELTRTLDAAAHPDKWHLLQRRLVWIAGVRFERDDMTPEQKVEVRGLLSEALQLVPHPQAQQNNNHAPAAAGAAGAGAGAGAGGDGGAANGNNTGADPQHANARLDFFYDEVAPVVLQHSDGKELLILFAEHVRLGGIMEGVNTQDAWEEFALSAARAHCKHQSIDAYARAVDLAMAAGRERQARMLDTQAGLLCVEVGHFDKAMAIFTRCTEAAQGDG